MKIAKKSPKRRPTVAPRRATLTLTAEAYQKIDALRGGASRSACVQRLVEQEEARRARGELAELLRQQYTPEVCRETLAVNDEFPIHES